METVINTQVSMLDFPAPISSGICEPARTERFVFVSFPEGHRKITEKSPSLKATSKHISDHLNLTYIIFTWTFYY